jgi:Na+/H+ antiporter NhaD/arsenite permease-like protein
VRFAVLLPAALLAVCCALPAAAAEEGIRHLEGTDLSALWALPFAGILLSIAIFPLAAPTFWHHHFGKVSAFWSLCVLVPFLIHFGFELTLYELTHLMLREYLPFIILLFALYTVAGGVRITGALRGTPGVNTFMLALGTVLASIMGTTGAAMLLIRPMIRANDWRRRKVHVFIFFIFLVANIGGSLTPLGDPPLFLGFLKGVDFFWPTEHLMLPMLLVAVPLLAIFYALDRWLHAREPVPETTEHIRIDESRFGIEGRWNLLLLIAIVAAVLFSGIWRGGIAFEVYGVELEWEGLMRDLALIAIALLSLRLTTVECRQANNFTWFPIVEVAKLFAGIFIALVPMIAILRAGESGALGGIIAAVTDEAGGPRNAMYFWITGALSSFLDNAPTYLVFFNVAGADPQLLMGSEATTLLAISAGAVFMGANSYIGNAPNFMVRSICEERGVKMPSFFGYMLWSVAILVPLFALTTLVFF